MSRPFTARYSGPCEDCDAGVKPGEEATYVGPGLVAHVACPPGRPPAPTCPTCHVEMPLTGVCDDCG